jgi:hypothetical protein
MENMDFTKQREMFGQLMSQSREATETVMNLFVQAQQEGAARGRQWTEWSFDTTAALAKPLPLSGSQLAEALERAKTLSLDSLQKMTAGMVEATQAARDFQRAVYERMAG